nr:hypothetical protein [Burkholderia cepacia]
MSTLAQIRSRPVMKPAVKAKNASVNRMKSRSLIRFTDIFPISVAIRESIPLGFDQCMKQIDKERDRNAPRNPQHGFPLLSCLPGKPAALVDIAGPRRCGGASGRTTATPRSTGEWDATV